MTLKVHVELQLATFHLDLAFHAASGQTTVLLGESGAGKSTVLRLLAGLQHPQCGLIELDGITYFDSERRLACPPQERPFGYVFQDYTLFPHLTVYENVAFGLKAQGMGNRLVRQRVAEALEQVRMVDYEQRRPAQLSGGQQQRVAIARALVLQPKLLLLDEPLSALDVQTKREVRQELRHILRQAGITTLLVTHHYIEALLLGQEILVLDRGRIMQQGNQRDLSLRPRSPYVAELVGVNFFQGQVVAHEAPGICSIQLTNHAETPVELQANMEEGEEMTREAGPLPGQEVCVVVDPRSVTLHNERPESSARNIFYGEIVQLVHTGAATDHEGTRHGGWVRVSLLIAASTIPLIAEITETSAERMGLHEGSKIYAAFKAMEARAYL